MEYEVKGPVGWRGGNEVCTSSPTESEMGGIISAWKRSVVGELWRVVKAREMSAAETAGNSSTYRYIVSWCCGKGREGVGTATRDHILIREGYLRRYRSRTP